jgi:hypothetical protein
MEFERWWSNLDTINCGWNKPLELYIHFCKWFNNYCRKLGREGLSLQGWRSNLD